MTHYSSIDSTALCGKYEQGDYMIPYNMGSAIEADCPGCIKKHEESAVLVAKISPEERIDDIERRLSALEEK